MAPSRGCYPHLLQASWPRTTHHVRRYSDFVRRATDPSNRAQIYVSRTHDPYLNLSIEHYLLQKSPADSTILFLYTDRPSIIIGRNQNPWVEVNLALQRADELRTQLVRRRSGGGTVFHDEGNVNYSVICPTQVFDRDRHAQMVVRALQELGVDRASVNERHDIVLEKQIGHESKVFKVSGSAYKLTRLRSLHHGTCLLSSPNLQHISKLLRSPGKSFIKARGVESVSSPITNVGLANADFEGAVIKEFGRWYGASEPTFVGQEMADIPEISKGLAELKSDDWLYCQTPQFTLSFNESIPPVVSADITARSGKITEASIRIGNTECTGLLGRKLHEIVDWRQTIEGLITTNENGHGEEVHVLSSRLDQLLGGRNSAETGHPRVK